MGLVGLLFGHEYLDVFWKELIIYSIVRITCRHFYHCPVVGVLRCPGRGQMTGTVKAATAALNPNGDAG